MPIVYKDGHWNSTRSQDEEAAILKEKVSSLSPLEWALVDHLISAGTNNETFIGLAESQWEEVPVPIHQWVKDPYYIGDIGDSIFTPVRESLLEIFRVPCFESDYSEIILTGGYGWGKSVLAGLITLRIIYELTCLRNLQASLGLMPGTKIFIMPIAHRVETARDVVFGEIVEKLRLIDYFRGKYKETLDEVRFKEKGLYIKGGASGDNAILGLSIFAAIVDESNFFGKATSRGAAHEQRGGNVHDRAQGIYEGLVKRIKSRFASKGEGKGRAVTGKLIMASSKRGTNDFTERRIKASLEEKRNDVFVRDLATWDRDPAAFAEVPRFKVLARSDQGTSRIISDDENYKPTGKELIIEVPTNWKRDFEQNPDKALRDIAGIATEGFDPFIKRRDTIKSAMTRNFPYIFSKDSWDTESEFEILWNQFIGRDLTKRPVPLCCPSAIRHAHLDMSGTHCATGFCIGHRGPLVELVRTDEQTHEERYEVVPVVHIDAILRITVPKSGEIHHPSVRQLLKRLHDGGLRIASVSMDQWNFIANKQELEGYGFTVEHISVIAKSLPYICLKESFYDSRIHMPWHERTRIELYDLEKDNKGKIIHPVRSSDGVSEGSRDLADALTGVVYYLTHLMPDSGSVVLPSRGISEMPNNTVFGAAFASEEETREDKPIPKKKRRGGYGENVPVFGIV